MGFRFTHDAAIGRSFRYPFLIVYADGTRPSDAVAYIRAKGIRVLNVAGNRESEKPGIGERTERFLSAVFRKLATG